MNIRIVADSSADMTAFEKKSFGDACFESVPMRVVAGTKEFVDDGALNAGDMLDFLSHYRGKSGSACPGVGDYLEAFGEAENVFCVTITSGLSGSCNAARAAAKQYVAMHPQRRVYVIDTLSAGPECALIAERLGLCVKSGLSFEEIVSEIRRYRTRTHLAFCLESLHNLANNGRVSHVVAKLAGVLGVRIVGQASIKGELETVGKARGAEKAIDEVAALMEKNGYHGGRVRIHHCENPRAAAALKKRLLARYPEAKIVLAETRGLCSFYAERGGFLVGYEGAIKG